MAYIEALSWSAASRALNKYEGRDFSREAVLASPRKAVSWRDKDVIGVRTGCVIGWWRYARLGEIRREALEGFSSMDGAGAFYHHAAPSHNAALN
jgi:hypothetical protein